MLGGTIKEMMEAEMDDYLGYGKSERSDSDSYRIGYKSKWVNSHYGAMGNEVNRKSTFEVTKKWTQTIRNCGAVYGELCIIYKGRLPD